jgi:hypothetical protein
MYKRKSQFIINSLFVFPCYFLLIGPSGVHALPLAAGRNEGGHYFRYIGPSGVRALPLAAGRNEGGRYSKPQKGLS